MARDPSIDTNAEPATLVLANFMPFRVNRLADAVSSHLSAIYRGRFRLEIPDWRVLVTVGEFPECTAQHIAASTRMHKTRVSRAVATLCARKLIARNSDIEDGREMRLSLTAEGRKMHAALVPLALERERLLLACLSDAERAAFLLALSVLEKSLRLHDAA